MSLIYDPDLARDYARQREIIRHRSAVMTDPPYPRSGVDLMPFLLKVGDSVISQALPTPPATGTILRVAPTSGGAVYLIEWDRLVSGDETIRWQGILIDNPKGRLKVQAHLTVRKIDIVERIGRIDA